MLSDFETLVNKAREVRSILLLTGEGSEFDAKRLIGSLELTEKIVVFRELLIQGKLAVGPRISEYFKTKNYSGFKESLDNFRELSENESTDHKLKLEVRAKIVGFIEDFLLSV